MSLTSITIKGIRLSTASLMEDYRRYYHLESYLFDEVGPKFREHGVLSAYDFFCIVNWMDSHWKSRIRNLLQAKGEGNLDVSVAKLAKELWKKKSPKDKLAYLMEDWRFHLPVASTILAVLQPQDFTITDKRVCKIIRSPEMQGMVWSDLLWKKYLEYKRKVEQQAPNNLSLRDKHQWLSGKAFHDSQKQWLTEKP